MDIIISAKDRQAAEANKYASILLEEIDHEKEREERRKAALAKKRDKKKMKKKKKAVDGFSEQAEECRCNSSDDFVKELMNDNEEKEPTKQIGTLFFHLMFHFFISVIFLFMAIIMAATLNSFNCFCYIDVFIISFFKY